MPENTTPVEAMQGETNAAPTAYNDRPVGNKYNITTVYLNGSKAKATWQRAKRYARGTPGQSLSKMIIELLDAHLVGKTIPRAKRAKAK